MKMKFNASSSSSLRQFHSIFPVRRTAYSLFLKVLEYLIKKVSYTFYFHLPDVMKAELLAVSL